MAQVDIVSLWTQGLQALDDENPCAAVLSAKELSIVWGSDSRYWKRVSKTSPINSQALEVAELITVCWLEIDGEYNASNLAEGKYGVYLVVELNNLNIKGPVTLKLTSPDGSAVDRREDLETKARNAWVGIKVGEFCNTACDDGEYNVKFSLNGCEGTTWKTGLTVIGAVIVPT